MALQTDFVIGDTTRTILLEVGEVNEVGHHQYKGDFMIRRLLIATATPSAIAGVGAASPPSATAEPPYASCKEAVTRRRYRARRLRFCDGFRVVDYASRLPHRA